MHQQLNISYVGLETHFLNSSSHLIDVVNLNAEEKYIVLRNKLVRPVEKLTFRRAKLLLLLAAGL